MANFFEKAIDLLDESNKSFLLAFAFTEEARAFPQNFEVENLGIKMGAIERLNEQFVNPRNNPEMTEQQSSLLNKELIEIINNYKAAFKSDSKRRMANLEDVFSKVEAYMEKKGKNTAADQTHARLQYMINGLFYHLDLDKDLQKSFSNAAHHTLSEFVASTDNVEHTFISFNYDLWLEKALYQKKLWLPRDGYGSYNFEYYSRPEEDIECGSGNVNIANKFTEKPQKSKVNVLKPHGSLSWRFGKNHENGIIILENGENSIVAYNKTWNYPPLHFPKNTEINLIPLIVPPAPNKIRSHPLFRKTDKDVSNALLHADAVVIVGWSMPLTDRYQQDIILNILSNREEQIKKLIVCDKRESGGDLLLPKFESIFRAREIKPWLGGFNSEFVDFLKKEV